MMEVKTTLAMGDLADSFTESTYQAGELARLMAIINVDVLDPAWRFQFYVRSTADTIKTLRRLLDIATKTQACS